MKIKTNTKLCIQGKMPKTVDCKATKILALVHSDLAGPSQPLAKDGYKYVLNFIDDYSGLTNVIFLKTSLTFCLLQQNI